MWTPGRELHMTAPIGHVYPGEDRWLNEWTRQPEGQYQNMQQI